MATEQVRNQQVATAGNGSQTDRFISAMLDMSPTEHKRQSPLRLVVSVFIHIALIAAVIITPIYFADNSLDLKAMTTTFLVAPPPPAPPPPPAAIVQKVAQVAPTRTFQPTPLVAPKAIPKTVAVVSDAPPPVNVGGGVVGGVAGGQVGGVLGGTLDASAVLPPPPPVAAPGVLRVGGNVKPPRLLSAVQPVYPPLARTAKVQGQVIVDAVIDEHGNVVKAHAVSGPGLLVSAALDAVEQWKYAPTFLNGVPVSIAMNVTVDFNMHGNEGY